MHCCYTYWCFANKAGLDFSQLFLLFALSDAFIYIISNLLDLDQRLFAWCEIRMTFGCCFDQFLKQQSIARNSLHRLNQQRWKWWSLLFDSRSLVHVVVASSRPNQRCDQRIHHIARAQSSVLTYLEKVCNLGTGLGLLLKLLK
jgi:hypothetical protein